MSAFIILIIGAGIGIALTIWVTGWIENGTLQIEAALCACLDDEAADHNEPTRAQIEWEAQIEEAIALTEADEAAEQAWAALPIGGAVAAHIARHEAESIAAEWAELNGSGGAA